MSKEAAKPQLARECGFANGAAELYQHPSDEIMLDTGFLPVLFSTSKLYYFKA